MTTDTTTTEKTTAQLNKELIIKLYDAISRADVEDFFGGCSPDMVIHEASSMAVGGIYRGMDELGGLLGQLAGMYDMTTIQMERIVADDDFVVAMGSFQTADHSYLVKITEWWRIEDGKVVEVRPYYWDTQELNQAIAASAK
jgi:ketosteroid isomerase-like protein